jgi:hypothetical protein
LVVDDPEEPSAAIRLHPLSNRYETEAVGNGTVFFGLRSIQVQPDIFGNFSLKFIALPERATGFIETWRLGRENLTSQAQERTI